MKKVLLLLVFLAVVFSAGCVQTDTDKEYPDYEKYERVMPPYANDEYYLSIGLGTHYGNLETPYNNLELWYSLHPEITDIIYQWADETNTAISKPKVVHNYIEIHILGKFIDGNPPKVQSRARYELTYNEKVQLDELYRRISEEAGKSHKGDVPVGFFYGAI